MRSRRQRASRGHGGAGERRLVIVESPAKARTIGGYLGDGYRVMATRGHVRDLPAKAGSVQPEDGFAMAFETGRGAARTLGAMAKALAKSGTLVLATDPDREGEAIAWQVLDWLRERDALGGRAVERVAFHEVTPGAAAAALARPRDIDMDLVHAWQARRALDYLVGYGLSPVLWRKLPGCRSAGRVQSVALRLICEREAEIEAFAPSVSWTVEPTWRWRTGRRPGHAERPCPKSVSRPQLTEAGETQCPQRCLHRQSDIPVCLGNACRDDTIRLGSGEHIRSQHDNAVAILDYDRHTTSYRVDGAESGLTGGVCDRT